MNEQRPILTTRQGHPVRDNQSLRSVGERGPATLENYQFIEKITHFDRERIPERVVHARGTGAHGFFEPYGTIGGEAAGKYTRARVLNELGVQTPIFVRFSTVIGGKESPETARDPRGFAIKFKTVDGNWDLVGNNLKVFFIRDAIKFPDMIHAFKPDPVTNQQEPWRFYDFICSHPEALHMVTWVKSPWGIPASYREMEGSGVNTYKLVNDQGVAHLVKFHFEPKQGVRNLTAQQAAEIQAHDTSHATRDLYEAIERGDYPEWEFCVQMMSDGEHPELDFDPLDDTKRWPEDRFPLLPVGRIVLNKNPDNVFAETEQSAFGTGVLVDGIDFSDDKMLQGRTLSYSDTQRYRVGPNYLQLPINQPQEGAAARTNQRDGQMTYYVDGRGEDKHINYEPSLMGATARRPSRRGSTTSTWKATWAATRPPARWTTTPRPARATAVSKIGNATTWSATSVATSGNARRRSSCAWCGTCGIATRITDGAWRKWQGSTWNRPRPCRRCRASRPRTRTGRGRPIRMAGRNREMSRRPVRRWWGRSSSEDFEPLLKLHLPVT